MEEISVFTSMVEELGTEILKLSDRRRKLIDELTAQLPEEVRNFTSGVRVMMLKELAKEKPFEEGRRMMNQLDRIDTLGEDIRKLLAIKEDLSEIMEEINY